MFMGVIDSSGERDVARDLTGARVMITGLTPRLGVDVARAFAELRARLIVQTSDLSPETTALMAVLTQSAAETRLYAEDAETADQAIKLAQNASQAFGGLDAVINLSSIEPSEIGAIHSRSEVENLIHRKMTRLAHVTHVAANRMRTVRSEGLILNVLAMPPAATGAGQAVATFARSALASMTRTDATAWADQGIRINGVGPQVMPPVATSGACLRSEPDIAALAVYLASRRGRQLSGHVFDAVTG